MPTINVSTSVQAAFANSLNSLIGNSAMLTLFSGAMPLNCTVSPAGVALAKFTGASPFGTVTSGILSANSIGLAIGQYTGTATFLRIATNANVAVIDLDVGLVGSNAAVTTTSTTVYADATVTLSNVTVAVLQQGTTYIAPPIISNSIYGGSY